MGPHHVIKKPLLTEKTTFAANEHNRHAFLVDMTATKDDIKAAIEELYGVRVLRVATQIHQKRDRRTKFGMVEGKRSKKAVVRVHPEDRIELL